MNKVLDYCKNHFVETIGFIVIIVLIFFISYLKYYRKTFTCDITTSDDSVKVYQKYNIKQKNNKIKKITYYYEVKSPNKEQMNQINKFYEQLIEENKDDLYDNHIMMKYKNKKLVLYYEISSNEIKKEDLYKSTRHFVKSLKASGFKCK